MRDQLHLPGRWVGWVRSISAKGKSWGFSSQQFSKAFPFRIHTVTQWLRVLIPDLPVTASTILGKSSHFTRLPPLWGETLLLHWGVGGGVLRINVSINASTVLWRCDSIINVPFPSSQRLTLRANQVCSMSLSRGCSEWGDLCTSCDRGLCVWGWRLRFLFPCATWRKCSWADVCLCMWQTLISLVCLTVVYGITECHLEVETT